MRFNFGPAAEFGEYPVGSDECRGDEIKNTGPEPITIKDIILPDPSRVIVNPGDLKGKVIQPGETVYISYCLNPDDRDMRPLQDTVIYDFGCKSYTRPINGEMKSPDTKLIGHRFPLTRVAEADCANIILRNDGNTVNTITGLVWDPSSPFEVDTLGRFPIEMQPDTEYDQIGVCFHPSATGSFKIYVEAENSEGLYIMDSVVGFAAEPKFAGMDYSFDSNRTGINRTTTFTISNSGGFEGDLIFDRIEGNAAATFSSLTLGRDFKDIMPGGMIDCDISFLPTAPSDFLVRYIYKVDPEYSNVWDHEEVVFTFTGSGIEPTVEAIDYDFGEHLVGDLLQTEERLFLIGGSDSVYVSELNIIGTGELTAPNLGTQAPNYYKLKEIRNTLQFSPTIDGNQSIGVEIVTDAGYAMAELRDTAWITAYAHPYPTMSSSGSINQEEIISCVRSEYELTMEFHSDAVIERLEVENPCVEFTVPDDFETYIVNGRLSMPIEILTTNESYCESAIVAYLYQDTVVAGRDIKLFDTIRQEFIIEPIVPAAVNGYKLTKAEKYEEEEFATGIGDTFNLGFTFDFTHDLEIEPKQELTLSLYFDNQLIYPEGDNTILKVGTREYEVRFTHQSYGLSFQLPADLYVESGTDDIFFEIRFLALLHTELETDVDFVVDIDDCFKPQLSTYKIKINEVCDYDLRTVRFFSNLTNVGIHYSPYSKELIVDTETEDSQKVRLELYDINGKLIHNSTFESGIGTKTHHTNLERLASGIYFVRLGTHLQSFNKKISITN
jgi:hypothetical protein